MPSAPPTIGHGLQREREWDALFTTHKHFAGKRLQAKVSTGITVEYAIHSSDVPDALEEVRLVLIMGYCQSMEWWTPLIEQLLNSWPTSETKQNLKILTFDNRGVGGTDSTFGRYTTSLMAKDTIALMDHLRWQQVHIGGISMGGMISMELAALAPARVQSLSLLVTTRGRFKSEASLDLNGLRAMVWNTKETFASACLALHPPEFLSTKMDDADSTFGEKVLESYIAMLEYGKLPTASGSVGQITAIATHYVSDERLAMISAAGFPVLIVGGGRDLFVPARESQKLAELMKDDHVKLLIMDNAGHGIFVECLHEVTHELLKTMRTAAHKTTRNLP